MESEKSLGAKIREYRIRAGLTQVELEIETNLASGTVSRLESNQINPTKETLVKIISILNLKTHEAAALFNLNTEAIPGLMRTLNNVSCSSDIDSVLQATVDGITKDLNLLAVSIFIIRDNELCAKTYTNSWYTPVLMKIISVPFNNLSISLDNRNNYLVKSILERKAQYSSKSEDFGVPFLPSHVLQLIAKATGVKSNIAIPIIYQGRALGSILFSRDYMSSFHEDLPILQAYTDFVGASLANLERITHLQAELISLKSRL